MSTVLVMSGAATNIEIESNSAQHPETLVGIQWVLRNTLDDAQRRGKDYHRETSIESLLFIFG